ncbi:MAG: RluA family pseudouridine synthase, partial [Chitinophagaceae bacterium]
VVHRLDQRVSGLMILAKTAEVQTLLTQQFANGFIKKQYKAVTALKEGVTEGTLTNFIAHNKQKQKAFIVKEGTANVKKAVLHFKTIQQSQKYGLLEIELVTGRFHQIRAQLAHIGLPIVGDVKYGFKRTVDNGSILLQSAQLSFLHPITKKPISISLPIPDYWKKYGFL